jgi:phage protein D
MSNNTSIPDIKSRITLVILVDNETLDYRFRVVAVSIVKEFNKISYADIIFLLDGDVPYIDFEASNTGVVIGNEIEIRAGYDGHDIMIFKGIIVKQALKVDHEGSNLILRK